MIPCYVILTIPDIFLCISRPALTALLIDSINNAPFIPRKFQQRGGPWMWILIVHICFFSRISGFATLHVWIESTLQYLGYDLSGSQLYIWYSRFNLKNKE